LPSFSVAQFPVAHFSGCRFFRCPFFSVAVISDINFCCPFFLPSYFSLLNFTVAQFSGSPIFRCRFSVALFSVALFTVAVTVENPIHTAEADTRQTGPFCRVWPGGVNWVERGALVVGHSRRGAQNSLTKM